MVNLLAALGLLAASGDAARIRSGNTYLSSGKGGKGGKKGKASASKPHVVLVLADDLGWTNLGYSARMAARDTGYTGKFFEAETTDYTPNIDKMVEEGVALTRHYSYSACTPSRQAVLTGRLPVRNGILLTEIWAWDGGVDPVWGYDGAPVIANGSSIARKFKDAGYYTAVVGKGDGYGNASPDHTPKGRGFDESLVMFHHGNDNWNYEATLQGAGAMPPCEGEDEYPVLDFWENNGPWKPARSYAEATNAKNVDYGVGVHKEDLYLERVLKIIKEHAKERKGQPLFLNYLTALVHTPLQVPKPYLDSTSEMLCKFHEGCLTSAGECSLDPDIEGEAAGFCPLGERMQLLAMGRYLDDNLGALRAGLEEAGMWDDTVLVFAADNGGGIGPGVGGNNWPLKGGKGADWEGGTHTLSFVSGGFLPKSARGTEMNQVMHLVDWHGTLLDLAGADWQTDNFDTVSGPVDAMNFWSNIIGESDEEVRDELHLSPWAYLQLQKDGHWLKLLTEVQGNTMWTSPEYPNNTEGAERPGNPAPIGPTSLPYECNTGCLYDLDVDPSEYDNLNATRAYRQIFAGMVNRLSKLNEENYREPWRGCVVDTYTCSISRNNYGSHYGPFINGPSANATCKDCLDAKYFEQCSGASSGDETEFGCVPKSTNECNCHSNALRCRLDDECEWSQRSGRCNLKKEFEGLTGAQYSLRTTRRAGGRMRNGRLGGSSD